MGHLTKQGPRLSARCLDLSPVLVSYLSSPDVSSREAKQTRESRNGQRLGNKQEESPSRKSISQSMIPSLLGFEGESQAWPGWSDLADGSNRTRQFMHISLHHPPDPPVRCMHHQSSSSSSGTCTQTGCLRAPCLVSTCHLS